MNIPTVFGIFCSISTLSSKLRLLTNVNELLANDSKDHPYPPYEGGYTNDSPDTPLPSS